jgi:hypothetical protein
MVIIFSINNSQLNEQTFIILRYRFAPAEILFGCTKHKNKIELTVFFYRQVSLTCCTHGMQNAALTQRFPCDLHILHRHFRSTNPYRGS